MDRPGRQKLLLIIYGVIIHIALIFTLFTCWRVNDGRLSSYGKSDIDIRSMYYNITLQYHIPVNATMGSQAVIFVGDSITQGLAVSAICNNAVNFGIAGDTTTGLIDRLPLYTSMNRARVVVLEIGVNDLAVASDSDIKRNYKVILAKIPSSVLLLVNAIFPVDESLGRFKGWNGRIADINQFLETICSSRDNCRYLNAGGHLKDDTGALHSKYHVGDGLHLSVEAYSIWIDILRDTLGQL